MFIVMKVTVAKTVRGVKAEASSWPQRTLHLRPLADEDGTRTWPAGPVDGLVHCQASGGDVLIPAGNCIWPGESTLATSRHREPYGMEAGRFGMVL